ncbi:MAG: 30S ribosome-binding factor RbfA [Candidatus Eremiobacteraeota bacterium]|nr:30S ribosome-binding factor RbfA [Candidatus Eremiobacteraeota bacterium]MBV8203461.1 30S ribosome-binding factor RbfA [Candidatus Eremiobacteraeota bacterium]MBV8262914.1 30S ribosome-binding factor RbfA [Candidatus Eremiobacteraeota bacterium]MBV8340473.1 30S ribosome-binding factor RbfA [Candidatus Eremiobacteraeota bacterium]MBV8460646.1 30S ribosome-binding factor RbfA [Candidatus Eremiobacteraeota bacterium]
MIPQRPAGKNQRLMRIEHEIVRELSEIVREELKDPRVGFVTIVGAEVSPDLRSARVYASPMGDERAARETMRGLQSAAGFLSSELGKRMQTRRTPHLTFVRDRSIEHGVRVSHIIDEVRKRDERKNGEQ